MKQTKLAQEPAETTREEQPAQPANQEIRQLQDLELALAGGGDNVVTWP